MTGVVVSIAAVVGVALALAVRAGQRATRGSMISIGLITAATVWLLLPSIAVATMSFPADSHVASAVYDLRWTVPDGVGLEADVGAVLQVLHATAVVAGVVVASAGIVTWRRHRRRAGHPHEPVVAAGAVRGGS